ncbi:MAG: hypothetical protein ACLQIQ_07655 [Beijerinckiaceae bacterium]
MVQVAGNDNHTVQLLPALCMTEDDFTWAETAFDSVIAGAHCVPGTI